MHLVISFRSPPLFALVSWRGGGVRMLQTGTLKRATLPKEFHKHAREHYCHDGTSLRQGSAEKQIMQTKRVGSLNAALH